MIEFIASLPSFEDDFVTKSLWANLEKVFEVTKGVCYYKHPVLGSSSGTIADLTIFTRKYQPIAIKCLGYQIDNIVQVTDDYWIIDDKTVDSPALQVEDFRVSLEGLINRDRSLRRKLKPKAVLALPLLQQLNFEHRFQPIDAQQLIIMWQNYNPFMVAEEIETPLTEDEWNSFRAVVQGVTSLTKPSYLPIDENERTMGASIRQLAAQIKTLDIDQERAYIQIAPGPQRIRGLAGTGKTVLLAKRVANVHSHDPNARILFTFSTRSLYQQIKSLIETFYKDHRPGEEPDWSKVHIRHAWGARDRSGVYTDLCSKQGAVPLNFNQAKSLNPLVPFRACCEQVMKREIRPEYDYVIVDEAQDLPKEFFKVLHKLAFEPKRICWAYDELQSIASANLEMPTPEELFGLDQEGKPLVVLDENDYPAGIPKDFVLNKSYRCPQDVLMLAHAIGLGLYSPTGFVQMLNNRSSWMAIGYEVQGELKDGETIAIFRPPENSPNKIRSLYKGNRDIIEIRDFVTKDQELDWVADAIAQDVTQEAVSPEHIMVIVLDALQVKSYAPQLQRRLVQRGVLSVIPGVTDDVDTFATEGRITLSSVFRAKGNEAYVVYILGFEDLYEYAEEIPNRNRAFTAISRSKAWVRITGSGVRMKQVTNELDAIRRHIPYFRFTFRKGNYRDLDAETSKRRQQRVKGDKVGQEFLRDEKLIEAMSPEVRDKFISKIFESLSPEDRQKLIDQFGNGTDDN